MLRLAEIDGRIDCLGLSKDTTVAELTAEQDRFCRQHLALCADCGGACCRHSRIWVDNIFYRQHPDLHDKMMLMPDGEVRLREGELCPFQRRDGRCGRYYEPRPVICQLFFCEQKAAEFYVRLVQCQMEAFHLGVQYENQLMRTGSADGVGYPLRFARANPVLYRKDYAVSIYDLLLFLQEYYRAVQGMSGEIGEGMRQETEENLFLTQSVLTHYFHGWRVR